MTDAENDKWLATYAIISAISIMAFILAAVIYVFIPDAGFLLAVLIFTFNPAFLACGIGLILTGKYKRISAVNKLIPFCGMIVASGPPFFLGDGEEVTAASQMGLVGWVSAAVFAIIQIAVTMLNIRSAKRST